jgi:hypothetical protein
LKGIFSFVFSSAVFLLHISSRKIGILLPVSFGRHSRFVEVYGLFDSFTIIPDAGGMDIALT